MLFLAISITAYIQNVRQEKTMEYLATVEIQDGCNDIDLILSSGERIALSDSKTELDKSDIKIVADQKSVSVSNIVPEETSSKTAAPLHKDAVKKEQDAADDKLNYLYVRGKEDFLLSLEDGSRIWMRHDSKVGFPNKFSKESRVIEFDGEGYFDIASDSLRPFIVKTKDIRAKVLGTEFNLKSNTAAPVIEISMISGRLAVENHNSNDILLTKDLQLVLDTEADSYSIRQSDNFKYKAWRDGYFFFENENLKDIIKLLSHMYEMTIVVKSDKYDNELFNGKIKRSNGLDKIISALEESYNFKFHIENGILYIY